MFQKGPFDRVGNNFEPNQLGEVIFEKKREVIVMKYSKREHWSQSHPQKRKNLLL